MKLSITLATLLALATSAAADNKEKADALFKQGKKLMGEKRYADACDAFEKSNKLDPGIGSQLNIGKCYQEWGKIGRAYVAYVAAEKLAKEQKDDRLEKIHALVVELEPNVPHLTINVPADAPKELKVTLDNRVVTTFGEPIVVDPGPHLLEWSVGKGGPKKDKVVPLDRGADSTVTIDIPKSMLGGPKPDDKKPDTTNNTTDPTTTTTTPPNQRGRNMRIGGIAMAGGGVLAIGISSVMTLSARGKYNDAIEMHCMGSKTGCDMTGLAETRDARSTANKATVVFIIGAALVGGGAAMYFLAPKGEPVAPAETPEQSSFYLTPSVSPDGVGAVVGGSF